MPNNFEGTAISVDQLESALEGLNRQLRDSTKIWYEQSGAMNKLQNQGRELSSTFDKLFQQFKGGAGVNQELLKSYGAQRKAMEDLEKAQQRNLISMQAMNFASKTTSDQLKTMVTNFSAVSSSLTNSVKGITGMALGYAELTRVLLSYNRTMYESSRVAEMYGESVKDVTDEIENFSAKTMFTKQGAAELNKSFKDMYLGIPPTTAAVRELAESLTGRLGYSQAAVAEGAKKLLQIQSTMPNVFEKIKAAQAAYAKGSSEGEAATAKLYTQLKALGVGYQDIRTAMQAARPQSKDSSGFMEFEKTMAKSEQTVKNAELAIAGKATPALKAVAIGGAAAAKGVSALSQSFILASVGAMAFGSSLGTLKKIKDSLNFTGDVVKWGKGGGGGAGIVRAESMLERFTGSSYNVAGTGMGAGGGGGSSASIGELLKKGPPGGNITASSKAIPVKVDAMDSSVTAALAKASGGDGGGGGGGMTGGPGRLGRIAGVAGTGMAAVATFKAAYDGTVAFDEGLGDLARSLKLTAREGGVAAQAFGFFADRSQEKQAGRIGYNFRLGDSQAFSSQVKSSMASGGMSQEASEDVAKRAREEVSKTAPFKQGRRNLDNMTKVEQDAWFAATKRTTEYTKINIIIKDSITDAEKQKALTYMIRDGIVSTSVVAEKLLESGMSQERVDERIKKINSEIKNIESGRALIVMGITGELDKQSQLLDNFIRVSQAFSQSMPDLSKKMSREGLETAGMRPYLDMDVNFNQQSVDQASRNLGTTVAMTLSQVGKTNVIEDILTGGGANKEDVEKWTKEGDALKKQNDAIREQNLRLNELKASRDKLKATGESDEGVNKQIVEGQNQLKDMQDKAEAMKRTMTKAGENLWNPNSLKELRRQLPAIKADVLKLSEEATAAWKKVSAGGGSKEDQDAAQNKSDEAAAAAKMMGEIENKKLSLQLEGVEKITEAATQGMSKRIAQEKQSLDMARSNLETSKAYNLGMGVSWELTNKAVGAIDEQSKSLKEMVASLSSGEAFQKNITNIAQEVGASAEGMMGILDKKMIETFTDNPALFAENFKKALEGINFTGDANEALALVQKALGPIRQANIDINGLTRERLELTKQQREGYLDAMKEAVHNAGAFGAIIGMQGKGTTQLFRAGGAFSMKQGAEGIVGEEDASARASRWDTSQNLTGKFATGTNRNVDAQQTEIDNRLRAEKGLPPLPVDNSVQGQVARLTGVPISPGLSTDSQAKDQWTETNKEWNTNKANMTNVEAKTINVDTINVSDVAGAGMASRNAAAENRHTTASETVVNPVAMSEGRIGAIPIPKANGGDVADGSYVVKASSTSANRQLLEAIGSSFVTGGVPGKDSVPFKAGNQPYMMMPGEAIVPPEYAGMGMAINRAAGGLASSRLWETFAKHGASLGKTSSLEMAKLSKLSRLSKLARLGPLALVEAAGGLGWEVGSAIERKYGADSIANPNQGRGLGKAGDVARKKRLDAFKDSPNQSTEKMLADSNIAQESASIAYNNRIANKQYLNEPKNQAEILEAKLMSKHQGDRTKANAEITAKVDSVISRQTSSQQLSSSPSVKEDSRATKYGGLGTAYATGSLRTAERNAAYTPGVSLNPDRDSMQYGVRQIEEYHGGAGGSRGYTAMASGSRGYRAMASGSRGYHAEKGLASGGFVYMAGGGVVGPRSVPSNFTMPSSMATSRPSGGSSVKLELNPEVADLLRIQGRGANRNGTVAM
jgi:hypothetical protein